MNEKQEIPEVQLNGTSIRSGASPKTRRGKGERASAADEAEGLRGMVQNLQNQEKEAVDVLRDQRRSIPALVVDFDYEVDRLSSSIECLIE